LQKFFYVLVAAGFGLFQPKVYGLAIAKISGTLASLIFLFKKSSVRIFLEPLKNFKEIALRYKDHPRYGIIPALLDVASVQGIVLILTRAYSTDELGYFGLTALVFSAPIGLIGGSFKEVFYQKIASHITNREFERAIRVFKKSALYLFVIALPVSLTAYFFGEDIFKIAFGTRWAKSGEFASILSVSFLFQLVVSPLSSVLYAANRLRPAFMWQSLYFMTTYLTLGISAFVFNLKVETLLTVYVIHEATLYSIYFLIQYSTLRKLS
jgi:O-antigen/teichoic acid export membrane protein